MIGILESEWTCSLTNRKESKQFHCQVMDCRSKCLNQHNLLRLLRLNQLWAHHPHHLPEMQCLSQSLGRLMDITGESGRMEQWSIGMITHSSGKSTTNEPVSLAQVLLRGCTAACAVSSDVSEPSTCTSITSSRTVCRRDRRITRILWPGIRTLQPRMNGGSAQI